ncbi:Hypothetical protein UVM_LOCUS495 [uncultured virus]|nr:Hypothetical protein UVM_LOCUS495 [uncultured virus]
MAASAPRAVSLLQALSVCTQMRALLYGRRLGLQWPYRFEFDGSSPYGRLLLASPGTPTPSLEDLPSIALTCGPLVATDATSSTSHHTVHNLKEQDVDMLSSKSQAKAKPKSKPKWNQHVTRRKQQGQGDCRPRKPQVASAESSTGEDSEEDNNDGSSEAGSTISDNGGELHKSDRDSDTDSSDKDDDEQLLFAESPLQVVCRMRQHTSQVAMCLYDVWIPTFDRCRARSLWCLLRCATRRCP